MQSYAAIEREFPFPINFENDAIVPREHKAQGQQSTEHIESTFPLWQQQQALLKLLVDDRRDHHCQLKNEGRNMKSFAPGDIVVVKKQVQTTQEKGPAKARMQARGPYRVLEQTKPGTYQIQRLPGVQGAGRRGKIMKESAARLTKIPSTLVIHKPAAGADTRLATYRHAIVDNPLENILGLHEPGRYRQAEPERPFAYDKIEDLWQEDVDNNWPAMIQGAGLDSDDDDSSDSDSDSDSNSDHENDNTDDNDDNNGNTANSNGDDNNSNNEEKDRKNDKEDDKNDDDSLPYDDDHSQQADDSEQHEHGQAKETRKRTTTATADGRRDKENPAPGKRQKRGVSTAETTTGPARTPGRATRKPTRYKQNEATTTAARPQAPKEIMTQQTQTKKAHQLYKRICKSRDKLFIIKYIVDTTNTTRWYVIQVRLDDDDTETTRNEGKYRVWFYICEHSNSKSRQLRNCRYWPEVHQLRPNGMLGLIVPIRPGRVEQTITAQPDKYKVFEQTVDLLEKALVGPFDFAVPKHYQNESNRVAFEEWEDLKMAAKQHNLDVTDTEEIIPLR